MLDDKHRVAVGREHNEREYSATQGPRGYGHMSKTLKFRRVIMQLEVEVK